MTRYIDPFNNWSAFYETFFDMVTIRYVDTVLNLYATVVIYLSHYWLCNSGFVTVIC
jgi:hypothetical protein